MTLNEKCHSMRTTQRTGSAEECDSIFLNLIFYSPMGKPTCDQVTDAISSCNLITDTTSNTDLITETTSNLITGSVPNLCRLSGVCLSSWSKRVCATMLYWNQQQAHYIVLPTHRGIDWVEEVVWEWRKGRGVYQTS